MEARAGSRNPRRVVIVVAVTGSVLAALIGCHRFGIGPLGVVPRDCPSFVAEVEGGAVGAESPEVAFESWLVDASPLVPRTGWTARPENGSVVMINGAFRILVLDLRQVRGSGWSVTEGNCN
jgi:hypothetical protein